MGSFPFVVICFTIVIVNEGNGQQGAERRPCAGGRLLSDGQDPCPDDSVPFLPGPPTLDAVVRSGKVYLRCRYPAAISSDVSRIPMVRYEVVLTALRRGTARVDLAKRLSTETEVYLDDVHLGDEDTCVVRTFYSTSPEMKSQPVRSEPIHLGLTANTQALLLKEGGKPQNITYELTLPLVCSGRADTCSLKFGLVAVDTSRIQDETKVRPDIFLSKCVIEFSAKQCRLGSCKQTIQITTGNDGFDDDARKTEIQLKLLEDSSTQWKEYETPKIKVTVNDVHSARCYVFGDPHIITFDRRKFDFYKTGTFVLYRSKRRQFEVDVRAWTCSETPHRSACACGVVAREKLDTISVDMCNNRPGGIQDKPKIDIKSGALSKNVKIFESREGKILTVAFGSGSFVRIYVENWGISLVVQAPSEDFNSTLGLCGTFDGNARNDFHDRNGQILVVESQQDQAYEFVERWRLLPGESLFDYQEYKQKTSTENTENELCDCSESPGLAAEERTSSTWKYCKTTQSIQLPVILHHMDVTARYGNIHHAAAPRRTRSAGDDAIERFRAYLAARQAAIAKVNHVSVRQEDTKTKSIIKIPHGERFEGVVSFNHTLATSFEDKITSPKQTAPYIYARSTIPYSVTKAATKTTTTTTTKTTTSTTRQSITLSPSSSSAVVTTTSFPDLISTTAKREQNLNRTTSKYVINPAPTLGPLSSSIRFSQSFVGKGWLNQAYNLRRHHLESTTNIPTTNEPVTKTNAKPSRHNQNLNIHTISPESKPQHYKYRKNLRIFQDQVFEHLRPETIERLESRLSELGDKSSYFFEGDFLDLDTPPLALSWPTSNGITHNQTIHTCSQVILNTSIAKACGEYLQEKMLDTIDICVKDIQVKGDTQWAEYSVPLVEALCEEAVWKKRITLSRTVGFPPAKVLRALNCPRGCSGRGTCGDTGCRCVKGFKGNDCTEVADKILLRPLNNGLCDTSASNCSSVQFETDELVPGEGVKCSMVEIGLEGVVRKGSRVTRTAVPVQIISQSVIQCNLPSIPVEPRAIAPLPIMWRVKLVSDDGLELSSKSDVIVYDSMCWDCAGFSKKCTKQNNSCTIDGACYAAGTYHPADMCQQCLPTLSLTAWSMITVNEPPVVTRPRQKLSVIAGLIFSYQIVAMDPEGSPLTFTSPYRDLEVTSEGKVTWRAVSNSLEDSPSVSTFKILISDECDATSTFIFDVTVYKCKCQGTGTCIINQDLVGIEDNPVSCVCRGGYSGKFCQTRLNACSSSPCVYGRCIATADGFGCSCRNGFTGRICDEEINICQRRRPCYPGVKCTPARGWYVCGPCPEGMAGNGRHCSVASGCATTPCFPGVTCRDVSTSSDDFICGPCPYGLYGDGVTCLPPVQDSTQSVSVKRSCESTCDGNRKCNDVGVCECVEGYTGPRCNTAICHPSCLNRGACVRPNVCQCLPGYRGERCEKAICDRPCKYSGQCIAPNLCSCPYGYVGPQCEKMVCKIPCHNGAMCIHPNRCLCRNGYTGPSCLIPVCDPACQNGGVCVRPNVCSCPYGYFGDRCEKAHCVPSCRNGGRCLRSNQCSCPPGWAGSRCHIPICVPRCIHGGRCVHANMCSCPTGWEGPGCTRAKCLIPCQHGGVCIRPNVCQCTYEYEGLYCHRPHCWNRCLYGGRCTSPGKCTCRPGFKGHTCAIRVWT